ncbi:FBD-associated F-box protein At1g66310-like [Rosa rugosa]|uniref:FBD-associated F-box protein At1g66310-like n=1 Tax=Rosa rugosa TaxID=74645 RepID=UPI002B40C7D7|nr:FBD-associated F-box protein At1g66310-like [Rosa rugosa]
MEQILAGSLLSTKNTARTCIFSKQWLRVWPLIPALDIDEVEDKNNEDDEDEQARLAKNGIRHQRFMNFLSMCLKRCEKYNNTLDKFRLRMRYFGDRNYDDNGIVSRWLSYAAERNRNVKELDICFIYIPELPAYTPYRLPRTLLINNAGSLTILKLENVMIQGSNDPTSFPCLRTMSLKLVEFSSNFAFLQLISGCPYIAYLSLKLCTGLSQTLKLSSLSLESLEVMHCGSVRFQIEATNLKSFKLHGGLYSWGNVDIASCKNVESLEFFDTCLTETWLRGFASTFPLLENLVLHDYWEGRMKSTKIIPNLLDATISIHIGREPSSSWNHLRLIRFLENFDCSRKLSLHAAAPEALIFPEEVRRCPPLPNLEHLQVEISFTTTVKIFSLLMDSLHWMAPSAAVSIHRTDIDPYPETELLKTIIGSFMKTDLGV